MFLKDIKPVNYLLSFFLSQTRISGCLLKEILISSTAFYQRWIVSGRGYLCPWEEQLIEEFRKTYSRDTNATEIQSSEKRHFDIPGGFFFTECLLNIFLLYCHKQCFIVYYNELYIMLRQLNSIYCL